MEGDSQSLLTWRKYQLKKQKKIIFECTNHYTHTHTMHKKYYQKLNKKISHAKFTMKNLEIAWFKGTRKKIYSKTLRNFIAYSKNNIKNYTKTHDMIKNENF